MAKPKPATSTSIAPASSAIQEWETIRGALLSELDAFETEIRPYVVESQEDLALLAEVLSTSKGHEKRTTGLMKTAVEPHKQKVAETEEVFKPVIERLKSLEKLIKSKIGDYDQRQRALQFAALEAASKANMSGNARAGEAALARADKAVVEPVKGMSIRYSIDIEIADEDSVPDEWWVVDEVRIGKYARATNGEIAIPGVVYHRTPIVSSKAR